MLKFINQIVGETDTEEFQNNVNNLITEGWVIRNCVAVPLNTKAAVYVTIYFEKEEKVTQTVDPMKQNFMQANANLNMAPTYGGQPSIDPNILTLLASQGGRV